MLCAPQRPAGLYSVTYDCRVGDWRRVLERLSELLERDGFSSIVAGSDITITWNNPTKGKKEKDEKEVPVA